MEFHAADVRTDGLSARPPRHLPPAITLHIIPAANPDGIHRIVGHNNRFTADDISGDIFPGRFNANDVDLNRNWDCDWQPTAVWRNQPVSAGEYPFSEPENQYLRDFIEAQRPLVVIFYHSVFDAIFTAGCPDTFPPPASWPRSMARRPITLFTTISRPMRSAVMPAIIGQSGYSRLYGGIINPRID
jgi:hypothetical protein